MIHLSVAIGRFVETLFYAILSVAGVVVGYALLGLLAIAVLVLVGRRVVRRRS